MNNTKLIKILLRIFFVFLIIVFSSASVYLIKLLTQEKEPLPTVKTKAASKTYKKILALNNLSPTLLPSRNEPTDTQNNNLYPSSSSPTVNEIISPTFSEANQEESEMISPTSIKLVTTPIVTEEESELLAYNRSTITPKASSLTISITKTKNQTLPETGFYQVSLVLIFISLFVIIFALVV